MDGRQKEELSPSFALVSSMAQPVALRFPIVPSYPREETIYGPRVPPCMVRAISMRWFVLVEGRMSNAVNGNRFLVRRDQIVQRGVELTVDYISARVMSEWIRYTVVYLRGHPSPFPHTVDSRDPIHIPLTESRAATAN